MTDRAGEISTAKPRKRGDESHADEATQGLPCDLTGRPRNSRKGNACNRDRPTPNRAPRQMAALLPWLPCCPPPLAALPPWLPPFCFAPAALLPWPLAKCTSKNGHRGWPPDGPRDGPLQFGLRRLGRRDGPQMVPRWSPGAPQMVTLLGRVAGMVAAMIKK